MKQCPQCGAQAADGSRFCEECGYRFPLDLACPQCGAPLAGNVAFCEQCGCNIAIANATPSYASQPTTPSQMIPPPEQIHFQALQDGVQPKRQPYCRNYQATNRNCSPTGKVVLIAASVPKLNGKWVVKDRMGTRRKQCIDFLLPKGDNYRFTSPAKVTIEKAK